MTKQVDLATWEELESTLRGLANECTRPPEKEFGNYSGLLFRGQAGASWELSTTLERSEPKFTELFEYYRAVAVAKTQVETFTGKGWDEIDWQEVRDLFSKYDGAHSTKLPSYDLLIYLRHHGFPSPLLDWTKSFYIAAFFAFRRPIEDRVAIYAYQEYAGEGKTSSSASSQIRALGPNIRSHPRHFLQQAEYTLCWRYRGNTWHSAPHASVFDVGNATQDRLWKFTLPASVAPTVLRRLDEYNINAFSLFQSEEALMETLARKTILLGRL